MLSLGNGDALRTPGENEQSLLKRRNATNKPEHPAHQLMHASTGRVRTRWIVSSQHDEHEIVRSKQMRRETATIIQPIFTKPCSSGTPQTIWLNHDVMLMFCEQMMCPRKFILIKLKKLLLLNIRKRFCVESQTFFTYKTQSSQLEDLVSFVCVKYNRHKRTCAKLRYSRKRSNGQ
jgi:hypothetical protein